MAVSTFFRSPYCATTSGAMIHMQMALAPAFGQFGLDAEGAGRYVPADLVPQELIVHEAQHGMRPGVAGEMRIEVHRIPPAHAQDASAPGRPHCCAPKRGRVMERPG